MTATVHSLADARRRRECRRERKARGNEAWARQREQQIKEGRARLRRLMGIDPEPPGGHAA